MASTIEIFCCYAHEDQEFLKALKKHLIPLQQQGLIAIWDDTDITPGINRSDEIERHLEAAQIILLLVSPDFISSDYCYGKVGQQVMKRHELHQAQVIPIILRSTNWYDAPFGKLQALPRGDNPVRSWFDLDEALLNVTEELRKVIDKIVTEPRVTSSEKPLKEKDSGNVSTTRPHLFSQSIKRVCPCCIEEFYPGDCAIMSRVTAKKVLKPAPTKWLAKQIARNDPEPLTSPKYMSELASRECPNCRYLLPYNIEFVENISIAVIGDVYSGKSCYIAALIHEIQERWVKENSKYIQLTCLTPEVEEIFLSFQRAMFVEHKALPASMVNTDRYISPLIYELRFCKLPDHPAKRVNLILYDDSGENYHDPVRMEYFARYVLFANAIVFLIDPNTVTEIYKQLPHFLSYTPEWRENRATSIINQTVQLIQQCHGSDASRRLHSMPVAMMVSKSDILKNIVPNSSYELLRNPTYGNYANLQDIKVIDEEVRAFIEECGEHAILRATQKFSNVHFFATSATGYPPDSNQRFPALEPCRCLDPLIWIFHSLGIIKDNAL